MEGRPWISIVILEYHSVNELQSLFDSIENNTSLSGIEYIISSNSCYDISTRNSLIERFPGVKWIFNEKNLGYAGGMNSGLKVANGEILIICNADIKIVNGLSGMDHYLASNPDVGAIGPRVVNSSDEIQDSCRPFLTIQGFVLRQLMRLTGKNLLQKNFDYDTIGEVDWINGAFIMFKREIFNKTGGFDSSYFLYAEDMDLCTRIRILGYKVIYYPRAKIIFNASRNARRSIKYMILFLKSHLRYWRKFGFFRISYDKKAES